MGLGVLMPKLFNLRVICSGNGRVRYLDLRPMTHDEACTVKTKLMRHPARHVELYELTEASVLERIASELEGAAWAARNDPNHYATHITERQKEENLRKDLDYAQLVRKGQALSFTTAQKAHYYLTGESVSLMEAACLS